MVVVKVAVVVVVMVIVAVLVVVVKGYTLCDHQARIVRVLSG